MPVNSTHTDYNAHLPKWTRIRDVLCGSDEVKARGEIYLPKPKGHDATDYSGYVMRAEFYPATQRTVDGLAGAIFRKDPRIEVPEGNEGLIEAITTRGLDAVSFAKKIVREVLELGRYGVLIDIRDNDEVPFAAGYAAESIINWRVGFIGRKPVLSLVSLREMIDVASDEDPFVTEKIEHYRILSLVNIEGGDGRLVYMQELYRKVEDESTGETDYVLVKSVVPTRRGEPLDHIPFVFFGPMDLTPDIQKSPILDLVDTNISHYRTSAELEEGAYHTGLPMYVISGRGLGEENAGEFYVGSRSALRLDEGGSAEVLSVSGDGMKILVDLSEAKERRMAVLGARLLEDQKSGVEAAATVAMRHRGENSLLGSLSDTCSRGMKTVLVEMIAWSGVEDPDVVVELNRDFTSLQLTGAELVQLTSAYQTGSIGPEVFFKALKDGERIPDGWTMEEWLADVEAGADSFERNMTNESADVVSFPEG
jgi:hypothetical protein